MRVSILLCVVLNFYKKTDISQFITDKNKNVQLLAKMTLGFQLKGYILQLRAIYLILCGNTQRGDI